MCIRDRYQEALDEFKAALELRPNATEALIASSQALTALGRKPESIQALEQARTLAPNNVTIKDELNALRGQ